MKVLEPLRLLGWEVWAWIVFPTGRLSGDVLIDVLAANPERAMPAVCQYAEELAEALP